VYINRQGQVSTSWVSRHPPLGILPDGLFSGETETVVFHEPGDLVLCSDGLVEAETPSGEWLGMDGVIRLLGTAVRSEDRFERLRQGLQAHLQADSGRDDISCMLLNVPMERRSNLRFALPGLVRQASVEDWSLDVSYSAHELRYVDVVPAVLGFITHVRILKPHQGALFLIISELFNNALDHGLLGLDSASKSGDGGFEHFLQERAERLEKLQDGHVFMYFHVHQQVGQAVLDITMQDSGPGFDFAALTRDLDGQALGASEDRTYGRGIALVRSLCEQVVYSGNGNKVWARYVLGDLENAIAADAEAGGGG
jgi:anti-sigma regulatory factor (Ser/Thr protein kinase)